MLRQLHLVLRFDDLAAALAEGNTVDYDLTAGIYAWDRAERDLFLDHAEAGVLYANRASGATTGAWPGIQSFCGWKGSGASGKGGLGPHYLTQFLREQSCTIMTE
jgi:1-pyrroline-5-carboxylate dehydrogenase